MARAYVYAYMRDVCAGVWEREGEEGGWGEKREREREKERAACPSGIRQGHKSSKTKNKMCRMFCCESLLPQKVSILSFFRCPDCFRSVMDFVS